MDIETLSTQLLTIDEAKRTVTDFERLVHEIREDYRMISFLQSFVEECEKMSVLLANERKEQSDELRHINQDINQLEDVLKSERAERDSRRMSTVRANEALTSLVRNVNKALMASGFDSDQMLTQEIPQHFSVNEEPEASTSAEMVRYLPQIPQFPSSIFPGLPSMFHNPAPQQRTEPNKLKSCDACGALIHRNAPTCPMCKTRSKSKNPKRKKKDPQLF